MSGCWTERRPTVVAAGMGTCITQRGVSTLEYNAQLGSFFFKIDMAPRQNRLAVRFSRGRCSGGLYIGFPNTTQIDVSSIRFEFYGVDLPPEGSYSKQFFHLLIFLYCLMSFGISFCSRLLLEAMLKGFQWFQTCLATFLMRVNKSSALEHAYSPISNQIHVLYRFLSWLLTIANIWIACIPSLWLAPCIRA